MLSAVVFSDHLPSSSLSLSKKTRNNLKRGLIRKEYQTEDVRKKIHEYSYEKTSKKSGKHTDFNQSFSGFKDKYVLRTTSKIPPKEIGHDLDKFSSELARVFEKNG